MDTPHEQLLEPVPALEKSRKTNRFLLIIVSIILLCIVVGGGYVLSRSKPSVSQIDKQPSTQSTASPTAQQRGTHVFTTIYEKTKSEENSFVSPVDTSTDKKVWWISDDNWNILVPPTESIIVKIRPTNPGVPNKPIVTKLNNLVKNEMIRNGYVVNSRNSSKSEADSQFYDYVQAYDYQDTHCVATSDPDTGSSGDETEDYSRFTFSCFTDAQLRKAYDEQISFLTALNDKTAVISGLTVQGNKARVTVNWRRTGAVAFMYRSGDTWKLIYRGQGPPACIELKTKHIPSEYWIDCLEGNEIKKGNFNF